MADRVNSFEDLESWQSARELAKAVYHAVNTSPAARDFGLRDQITRAAVSVMSNIAEGFERRGLAEKAHFYNIARASCGETRSLFYLLIDLQHVTPEHHHHLQDLANRTGRLLTGLIRATDSRQT